VASWIGFYIHRAGELVLGPFQGNVACVRIAIGRGVCGTAAAERRTVIVPDVDQFPGHIACDAGSRSEIVLPIVKDGQLVAVLDLDSYELAAFDEVDAEGLGKVTVLAATLAWLKWLVAIALVACQNHEGAAPRVETGSGSTAPADDAHAVEPADGSGPTLASRRRR